MRSVCDYNGEQIELIHRPFCAVVVHVCDNPSGSLFGFILYGKIGLELYDAVDDELPVLLYDCSGIRERGVD